MLTRIELGTLFTNMTKYVCECKMSHPATNRMCMCVNSVYQVSCSASFLLVKEQCCFLSFPSEVGSGFLKWAFLCGQFGASLLVLSGNPCTFLLAMASVVSYSPPWWVNLLHRLPHFNLRFEQTSSDFQPEDWTYQQVKKKTKKPFLNPRVNPTPCVC